MEFEYLECDEIAETIKLPVSITQFDDIRKHVMVALGDSGQQMIDNVTESIFRNRINENR